MTTKTETTGGCTNEDINQAAASGNWTLAFQLYAQQANELRKQFDPAVHNPLTYFTVTVNPTER